jgi:alpha-N-acetylglucosamine transferase
MEKERAWVTYLTTNSYVYGVITLWESLLEVGSKYPLKVFVTDNVKESNIKFLMAAGMDVSVIPMAIMPRKILDFDLRADVPNIGGWNGGWSKLHVLGLGYEKVVHLDADVVFLKNADELFDKPDMSGVRDLSFAGAACYIDPKDEWHSYPNAGVIVVDPSPQRGDDFFRMAEALNPEYPLSDQSMLKYICPDWPNRSELHLPNIYNFFAPKASLYSPDQVDRDQVKIVHYVWKKPWDMLMKGEQWSDEKVASYYERWSVLYRNFIARTGGRQPESVFSDWQINFYRG